MGQLDDLLTAILLYNLELLSHYEKKLHRKGKLYQPLLFHEAFIMMYCLYTKPCSFCFYIFFNHVVINFVCEPLVCRMKGVFPFRLFFRT